MKTRDMMYISLFAAIMAVLGLLPPIPLPFSPVPITMQTLGVMLAGSILGAKRGGASLLVFILLVAVGAPILSGGRGGMGVIFGPSGGYIISWPIAALVIGYFVERFWNNLSYFKLLLINLVGGILIVYAFGIPVLAFYTNVGLLETTIGNLAFIPGDMIKVIIASYVAIKVKNVRPIVQTTQSKTL
jgi:biotin transport system substrate-specific component